MEKTVKVLGPSKVQYEDGSIVERSAMPIYGPPRKGLRWLPALGEYVHEALFDEFPFVVEIDEDDETGEGEDGTDEAFDKKQFVEYLKQGEE